MKILYIIFVLLTTMSVLAKSSSTWSTWWGADIQQKLSSILPNKMPKLFKKLPLPKTLLLGISLLEPYLFSKKIKFEELEEKMYEA